MKKRLLSIFLCSAIILSTSTLFGQALALDLLRGKSKVTIPFTFRQGFIIIDLQYQFFIPISLIFDTGAQNTIIFDKKLTDIIQTNYEKEISLLGADYTTEIPAYIARNVRLSIPERQITAVRDILVLKEDVAKLGDVVGQEIHGILGNNFFKGMIIEIDYRENNITIHDPRRFRPKKYRKYEIVDLKVINTKPYIYSSSQINDTVSDSLLYLIDTGASLSLLFQVNYDNRLQVPETAIEGPLGKGLGGELMGYLGVVDTFYFANILKISKPLSYFQRLDTIRNVKEIKRDGIIGNTLLERLDIVIDYHHQKFYFKPNKSFKKPFKYDKSGVSVIASGPRHKKYIVNNIRKGSPADIAGLKLGDEIVGVNWRPHFLTNLEVLNNYFTKKEGTRIKLKIKRKGSKLTKLIILNDIF